MAAMGARRVLPLLVFLVGLVVIGGAVLLQLSGVNRPALATVGGPFTLKDQNGNTFTDKDLAGAPTLIFFGFTFCPDICPTTLFDVSEVLRAAGDNGDKVRVLFVSVDPERDTPDVLKDYLSGFDARILGLTGTQQELDAIIKAYKVYARKIPTGDAPDDYTMDHTAIVYLLDKQGNFVNAFNLKRPPEESVRELGRYL